ncbi:vWA domain-containing protein [Lihuaxuella thermophila]|uniref:D-amino-acid dehydrogenase/Ca-activated chloride channel family protein n=1 Tax=Lihuaxuella thermophila TaxID=1173111 RepID=A0A1H8HS24_9BACL|nr:D-amino-acid dehydrogenase/Ca-activated chloride channel family protein [Lihuaxuella thermophila]
MKLAKQKLANQDKAENIVYVVSDGVETCGGDPVQAAKELHESNMKAVVNIIGFDLDDAGQKALQAVADAGGGEYSSVDSEVDLDRYFEEERSRLYKAWSHWANEHYDKAGDVANKKYEDLQRKSHEMYQITDREEKRFYHMSEYLEKERGFEFELLYNHVNQKFSKRADYINDYNFYKRDKLQEAVLDNKNKIQDEVLDKADEEKDKLY